MRDLATPSEGAEAIRQLLQLASKVKDEDTGGLEPEAVRLTGRDGLHASTAGVLEHAVPALKRVAEEPT